jgi:acetyl-CoA carboxylase carboxyltransferase component/biotin carboxyl carrier protein
VLSSLDVEAAFARCQSEAKTAFGSEAVYVEEFLRSARHIEVQLLGDLGASVTHLGERECSVQRRFQKVIEIAPAPFLDDALRHDIIHAALRFAGSVGYSNLGTFEFLVDTSGRTNAEPFVFIEANARLQVEHTVTEEVTGVDLVQTQIRLAQGETLQALGLADPARHPPRGYAIQARVNLETLAADGSVRPGGGTLTAYEPPQGRGVRTDGFGYAGYSTSSLFDSLLAKVIVHSPTPNFTDVLGRARRALSEFRLEGVTSNLGFLQTVLAHPDLNSVRVHTRWLDAHLCELVSEEVLPTPSEPPESVASGFAGARVSSRDPLALFAHDAQVKSDRAAVSRSVANSATSLAAPDGTFGLSSSIQGTIVNISVGVGDAVREGQQVAVIEAMKMEHVIHAERSGIVRQVTMRAGDVVREGFAIIYLEQVEVAGGPLIDKVEIDPDHLRADLREAMDRHALTRDEQRPEVVSKRHQQGSRMARENISELVDEGSFKEYWPLVVARQHQRHDIEALRKNTPADGVVAGTCSINGGLFDDEHSRAIVVHYDYTVLAGTQGHRNHYKQDRMFDLAHRYRLPIVLFGEGGGGRPGEDYIGPRVAFDTATFSTYSKLSALVPLVAIVNGRTFAGNTALVACSDVIIATENATLGMGGPAMIEGGGLGIYTPEEVGPMSFQVPNGVVDILVKDEKEAVAVAKKYLSYFQGAIKSWQAHDQRSLRHVIPENRLRLYDMRELLHTLADQDSILEIREKFGVGIITAFVRFEGKPMGVIANNPHHLAGAIDSDGADKAARFMKLCDAFDIPILSLMDCPGIMVGPDAERTALVRHSVRLFNAGANLTTPLFAVAVRKAYGLGVQAMCGASALEGFFTVAWPTAEFSGMNIEGMVKLGYRKELASITDPEARKLDFDQRVAKAYDTAKAVNASAGGGIDDVIDPADTRSWIVSSLRRLPVVPKRTAKKYPCIDTW